MRKKKMLILIAIFILTITIINLIIITPVQAVTQIRSADIDTINEEKYPETKQMIEDLQAKHPNWNFKILYTGLDWNEVIVNEYVGHGESPRNLVPVGTSYLGEWICESCTENKYYDNGNWRCASEKALQYMMDARNSINDSDIFQFMELTYQECTLENIKPMVTGTFLDNDSYINAIIEAGKKHNVSPYYIVALAVQEQGKSGSSTISGTYAEYEGYYNIFNINASGNSKETIIKNALSYAKNNGWDTLEKAIDGGVEKISTSYIARGQDTLYLQKFDVDNSDGKLYWHQYQQNIMAAQNEGVTIRKTFEEINSIESAYTFVIPVYENMPAVAQTRPLTDKNIDTSKAEQVRVNVKSSLNLRATPGGSVIGSLLADEIVTIIERGTEKINGTYWDKVIKSNGVIGYAARETYDYEPEYKLYLIPIVVEEPEEQPEDNPEGEPTDEPTENPEETPSDNPTDEPVDEPTQEPEQPAEDKTILPEVSNDKIKIEPENNLVTIIPGATLEEIISLTGKEITAKDKNGNTIENISSLGTGSVINDKYIVVMRGDINGDSKVDTADLLAVQKQLLKISNINENEKIKAADINKDGKIDTADLLAIQKKLLNISDIKI